MSYSIIGHRKYKFTIELGTDDTGKRLRKYHTLTLPDDIKGKNNISLFLNNYELTLKKIFP